ncbi:MAG: hypothetical protein ACLFPO_11310 [Spirochaetaceae bacterium]
MSAADISAVVFYAPRVLLAADGSPVALMPQLVRELGGAVDLTAVCPDEETASHVSRVYGHATGRPTVVATTDDHRAMLRELLAQGSLNASSTLFIDHHPRRCMEAVKLGIHAGIFEDAPRLYRDLGLWGLVPLIHNLREVENHLSG